MTHKIIEESGPRTVVNQTTTIGDVCMDAMDEMMKSQYDVQNITVMKDGTLYYFDVMCVGIKPPYELREPEKTGDMCWFGQRPT